MPLSATSTCLLNTSRDGDSTTSLGSLFQCWTTLSVKKFFLISSLNLPWCNLRPFALVLSQASGTECPRQLCVTTEEKDHNPLGHNHISILSLYKGIYVKNILFCDRRWTFQVREKFLALKPPEGFHSKCVVVWYNLTVRPRSSDDITKSKASKGQGNASKKYIPMVTVRTKKINFYGFKNESDNHILLKEDNT